MKQNSSAQYLNDIELFLQAKCWEIGIYKRMGRY